MDMPETAAHAMVKRLPCVFVRGFLLLSFWQFLNINQPQMGRLLSTLQARASELRHGKAQSRFSLTIIRRERTWIQEPLPSFMLGSCTWSASHMHVTCTYGFFLVKGSLRTEQNNHMFLVIDACDACTARTKARGGGVGEFISNVETIG
jgi:hypothetical protein